VSTKPSHDIALSPPHCPPFKQTEGTKANYWGNAFNISFTVDYLPFKNHFNRRKDAYRLQGIIAMRMSLAQSFHMVEEEFEIISLLNFPSWQDFILRYYTYQRAENKRQPARRPHLIIKISVWVSCLINWDILEALWEKTRAHSNNEKSTLTNPPPHLISVRLRDTWPFPWIHI
jgi:hypothetical protein